MIDLRPQDTAIVQSILAATLGRDVKTWVFGSRASGASRRASDLDLLIDAGRLLKRSELAAVAQGFADSDLPFSVDVADFHALPAEFRTAIAARPMEMLAAYL